MICLCTLASCLDAKYRRLPGMLLLSLLAGAAVQGVRSAAGGTCLPGLTAAGWSVMIMKVTFRQLLGAFCFSLPLTVAALLLPDKIGGGDLKMGFLLGLYLTDRRVEKALAGTLAAGLAVLLIWMISNFLINKRKDTGKGRTFQDPVQDRPFGAFPYAVCLTAGFIAGFL